MFMSPSLVLVTEESGRPDRKSSSFITYHRTRPAFKSSTRAGGACCLDGGDIRKAPRKGLRSSRIDLDAVPTSPRHTEPASNVSESSARLSSPSPSSTLGRPDTESTKPLRVLHIIEAHPRHKDDTECPRSEQRHKFFVEYASDYGVYIFAMDCGNTKLKLVHHLGPPPDDIPEHMVLGTIAANGLRAFLDICRKVRPLPGDHPSKNPWEGAYRALYWTEDVMDALTKSGLLEIPQLFLETGVPGMKLSNSIVEDL